MADTTLGGVTLAQVAYDDGYEREEVDIGAVHNLADGSTKYDYVAARFQHKLKWNGITVAERNTIYTEFEDAKTTAAGVAFQSHEGISQTVRAVPDSYKDYSIPDSGGTLRYFVEMELEDVS